MYKTTYQAALDAQKLKYEDLYPKTREQLDQVINVENELAGIYESLKDAEPEDKPAINENIGTIEHLLKNMDEAVVKKINTHNSLKDKVAKMQDGLAKKGGGGRPPGSKKNPPAAPPSTPPAAPDNTQQQTPDTEPAKVVSMPAAATPPAAKKEEDGKEKPKKRNWFALVATAVFTVALAGYGIHANQNKLWPFNKK